MTDQIAIHTEGLTKHYGDLEALVDLDLEYGPARCSAFSGPTVRARRR